ncbi:cobalamin-dependent protein [Anaerovorax odorimutans]|uniref:Cobalamin-dependent protein n=1 Tax=Anaerovorax odorimutans TaxID=109327 RepID=A0ABT1RRN3_9FIRM|nr:cobalamin B12-binding domain-containing protein [Anaerovorax odorimutans]MCQ4637860.1 cobalamin-dependent protein [Anaerovorax odorimutans]
MARASKEYIKNLIPPGLPDGREILEHGRKIGPTIKAGRSRLVRDSEFDNYLEYFRDHKERKEIAWFSNVGLATIEEEVEGIKELQKWCKKLNIKYHSTLAIPSTLSAIPKELRQYDSKNTSYVLENPEDFMALGDIEGMEVIQSDQVLAVPNAWFNGINALKAGSYQVGCFSQLLWNYPGCEDHVKYVADMLRVMGVLSSKRSEGFGVSGYLDDTYPSYCKDAIAWVGYALFEQYIADDLCDVIYQVNYGGLISDIRIRAALLKALYDSLWREKQPLPVAKIQANTTRFWDHDIEANYGMLSQEMLMAILAERRYNTGAVILPVPITEKVHVPTIEAIKGMLGVCSRLEENIEQWEDVIDFSYIDEMAEVLKTEGIKFFRNMLDILDDSGLDIEDPMQMLMFVKNFNAGLFEETFHPSMKEKGKVEVHYYTDMGRLTQNMIDEGNKTVGSARLEGKLKGKTILIASTDAHVYGLQYVRNILETAGAKVVDAGVDASVQYIFDTADEEGIRYIGVSTHNGQALGIADQLLHEMQKRDSDRNYLIFMGGRLNTILPGHSEPSDVTEMINRKGILAENNLVKTIRTISES